MLVLFIMKDIFTVKEACDYLGYNSPKSGEYLRQLIRKKVIPAGKFGRDWLIMKHDLDNYLANKRPIGRPAKTKRPYQKLTQDQRESIKALSNYLGVTSAYLRQMVLGYKHPSKNMEEYLEEIAKELGVTFVITEDKQSILEKIKEKLQPKLNLRERKV